MSNGFILLDVKSKLGLLDKRKIQHAKILGLCKQVANSRKKVNLDAFNQLKHEFKSVQKDIIK